MRIARPAGAAAAAGRRRHRRSRSRRCVLALRPTRPRRATTYKWVDDQGVVHYTDKLPPEAVNKGSVELNKQGVPIKKIEPALTPEQRRARDAEEERARQVAKARDGNRAQGPRAAADLYDRERNRPRQEARAAARSTRKCSRRRPTPPTLNKRKKDMSVPSRRARGQTAAAGSSSASSRPSTTSSRSRRT